MYIFSANSEIKVSIFNRAYSKGVIDSKTLSIKVEQNSVESFNLNELKKSINSVTYYLDNRIIIQNDDPYLIHLLEPKTGATVHNMLNTIRNMEEPYKTIGDTLPPDTINGYKLTVFNNNTYTATMEGIAKFIYDLLSNVNICVTVSDGTFSVQV